MNQYGERLRELEDALDAATSDWLWWGGMLSIASCQYCEAEAKVGWKPGDADFPHLDSCPRVVLTKDRIGYVRGR